MRFKIAHIVYWLTLNVSVTDVASQSPGEVWVVAPGIFHLDRYAIASRVFDLKRHAIGQALTPRVFHLNHPVPG
jgi:hypothetical protein